MRRRALPWPREDTMSREINDFVAAFSVGGRFMQNAQYLADRRKQTKAGQLPAHLASNDAFKKSGAYGGTNAGQIQTSAIPAPMEPNDTGMLTEPVPEFKDGGTVEEEMVIDYPGAAAARAPLPEGYTPPPAPRAAIPMPAAPVGGALDDQRRTAAFNPETEGPLAAAPAAQSPTVTPAGNAPLNDRSQPGNLQGGAPDQESLLQKALDGGLQFAQHVFHLKGDGAALPGTDPHREKGARALMQGVGAASPEAVAAMDNVVNSGKAKDEAIWGVRRLAAIYEFYSSNGETEKANKAAFELMQYSAGMAAKHGQAAIQMLHGGDQRGAAQQLIEGHSYVPDGRKLVMGPDGKSVTVVDAETGKPVQQIPVTPQVLFNAALGLSNRSMYWDVIMNRAVGGNGRGTGGRSQTQEELDRARIELTRARTEKTRRGPVGRGGATTNPAVEAILEGVAAIRASRGRAPATPPQGSNDGPAIPPPEEDTSGEGDDEDNGAGRAAPANANGEGGGDAPTRNTRVAPNSVMRVQPPRAGSAAAPAGPPSGGAPTKFDPEGDGYDYDTARQAGLAPDKDGHWPSRDPRSGVLLKGRKHPTSAKGDEADAKLGYYTRKREDGRYESINPDEVPEREIWSDGAQYRLPPRPGEPKPFDQEPPDLSHVEKLKQLQLQAAKIPAKQGGAQVRQVLQQELAEAQKELKAYQVARRQHDINERRRVGEEHKLLKADQKATAGKVFDLTPKTPRDMDGITKELNEAFDGAIAKITTPDPKKQPDEKLLAGTVFGDKSATADQLKTIALDIRTANPRVNGEKAYSLIGDLTRIGSEPHERGFTPRGKDSLGNVILQINGDDGKPTGPLVHMRQQAYSELTQIVRKRFQAKSKGAEAPAEKGAVQGAKEKFDALPQGAIPSYAINTLPGEAARAGAKLMLRPQVEATKMGIRAGQAVRRAFTAIPERRPDPGRAPASGEIPEE